MVDFAKLKQKLKDNPESSLEDLQKQAEKANNKNNFQDERLWYPTRDKSGNGRAIVRFLPAKDDSVPWVKTFHYSFQGPTGQWYIENSPKTIGLPDPVAEHNAALWATKVKANEEVARKTSRRTSFYSNVLVISDDAKPENNGKVFLYKYGMKIWGKIDNCLNPKFDGDPQFDPSSPWHGADFELKIFEGDNKFADYSQSNFRPQKAISEDDTVIETIFNKTFGLLEFTDPENFKNYEQLQERFAKVMGKAGASKEPVVAGTIEDQEPVTENVAEVATPVATATVPDSEADSTPSSDDNDEDQNYFKKLAQEG